VYPVENRFFFDTKMCTLFHFYNGRNIVSGGSLLYYTAPSNAKEVVDAILETAVTRVLTPEELETVKTSMHELSTTRFRRLAPAENTEEGSAPVTARPVLASSSGTKRKRGIDKEGNWRKKGIGGIKDYPGETCSFKEH
jgi:hypothetical protein